MKQDFKVTFLNHFEPMVQIRKGSPKKQDVRHSDSSVEKASKGPEKKECSNSPQNDVTPPKKKDSSKSSLANSPKRKVSSSSSLNEDSKVKNRGNYVSSSKKVYLDSSSSAAECSSDEQDELESVHLNESDLEFLENRGHSSGLDSETEKVKNARKVSSDDSGGPAGVYQEAWKDFTVPIFKVLPIELAIEFLASPEARTKMWDVIPNGKKKGKR